MLCWDNDIESYFEGAISEQKSIVVFDCNDVKIGNIDVTELRGFLVKHLNAYRKPYVVRTINALVNAVDNSDVIKQYCLQRRLNITIEVHCNKEMYM